MGRPLYEENDTNQRRKTYFEKLMNEGNKRRDRKVTKANKKEVERITKKEVMKALQKMKNNIAVATDEISVEAWKALGTKETKHFSGTAKFHF